MEEASGVPPFLRRQLQGLSVYQDIVLDGQVVLSGARDGHARWELIATALSAPQVVLDVGSNFGWFGLQVCQRWPQAVVASVEADLRSAAVQRTVLASHRLLPMVLLTSRGGVAMVERFAAAGQRFDAALVLNVLHWMADHRQFLQRLATICRQIVIEHPDPREPGAGVAQIRQQIGAIGDYLPTVLPNCRHRRLGAFPSYRAPELERELWLVETPLAHAPPLEAPRTIPGRLAVEALIDLEMSWPPRSYWLQQLRTLPDHDDGGAVRALWWDGRSLAAGVQPGATGKSGWKRRLAALPENTLLPPQRWLLRTLRRWGARIRDTVLRR